MKELIQAEVLKKVADGIAHKIRNPLGIMSTAVQFCIAYPQKKDKVKNHLENIHKCIKDIEKTLEYINIFCRPIQLDMKPSAVKEFLDGLFNAVQDRCRIQNVKLIEKYRHTGCKSIFDRDFLEEAFLNLIINSLEAMPDGGALSLESYVDSNNKEVIVKFADTGTGIIDRHINEIFEPFFTTKENHIGLGLYIARRIIEAHKGRIEVNANKGKGTIVVIHLPCIIPGE